MANQTTIMQKAKSTKHRLSTVTNFHRPVDMIFLPQQQQLLLLVLKLLLLPLRLLKMPIPFNWLTACKKSVHSTPTPTDGLYNEQHLLYGWSTLGTGGVKSCKQPGGHLPASIKQSIKSKQISIAPVHMLQTIHMCSARLGRVFTFTVNATSHSSPM